MRHPSVFRPLAVLLLAVSAALAAPSAPPAPPAAAAARPEPTRIAFLTLGQPGVDVVGPHVNAQAMLESLRQIPADQSPQVIVLKIHSDGGMLAEVPRLSDAIQDTLKPRHRVVAWVDKAISAAALAALTCDEIIMTPGGTLGAAVTYVKKHDEVFPLTGDDAEKALAVGAEVARRGGREPLIVRSMQTTDPLSCTLTDGQATGWRADETGPEVVNRSGEVLTLTAQSAAKLGVSKGTADTKEEVAKLLGVERWTDVSRAAEDHQGLYRRTIRDAETRVIDLRSKREQAVQRVRNPKSPEDRRTAMVEAGRADAEVGKIFREFPQLREYFLSSEKPDLGPLPGVSPTPIPAR